MFKYNPYIPILQKTLFLFETVNCYDLIFQEIKTMDCSAESIELIEGDCLEKIQECPDAFYQCCITSPPYWGMRSYGEVQRKGEIGNEEELEEYIHKIVCVFQEIRRVLKKDGCLWLNIGDGYTSGNRKTRAMDKKNPARAMSKRPPTPKGLKPKDLIGFPWRIAFALQADGWYLRSDVIWEKPNAQPESVKDRPTRSHEYLFLLTKSKKYYYDWESIQEIGVSGTMRNRRSVWRIPTKPFRGRHFATFPEELVRLCLQASTIKGSRVIDPFCGSGTVGKVCQDLHRSFLGIEIHPEYVELAEKRIKGS